MITITLKDGMFKIEGALDSTERMKISKYRGVDFCGKELVNGEWKDKSAVTIISNYLKSRNHDIKILKI